MLGDVYLKKGSDPIQSLIHYKKASELAPYETSYLIRMVLIASAAEVQWARVSKPWRRSIPGDLASITLNEHGGEMRLQLDRSIFGRITEQLRLQPVHDRVEGALKILTNCILEQPRYCGSLYKGTVSWYQLALDNPRGNISIRKKLSIQLVRLYLGRGNLRQALRVAKEARSLDPLQPALAIMEANIHILAKRPDEANRIIRSLMESGITLSKTDQEEAEKIFIMIKQQH
jgi:tetratricopeptide (TPR) repeat protein